MQLQVDAQQVDPRVEARENYADGDWVLEAALPAVVEVIPAKLRAACPRCTRAATSCRRRAQQFMWRPRNRKARAARAQATAGDRSVWLEPRRSRPRGWPSCTTTPLPPASTAGVMDGEIRPGGAGPATITSPSSRRHRRRRRRRAESAARCAGLAPASPAPPPRRRRLPGAARLSKTSVWKHRFVHRAALRVRARATRAASSGPNSLFEGCRCSTPTAMRTTMASCHRGLGPERQAAGAPDREPWDDRRRTRGCCHRRRRRRRRSRPTRRSLPRRRSRRSR